MDSLVDWQIVWVNEESIGLDAAFMVYLCEFGIAEECFLRKFG